MMATLGLRRGLLLSGGAGDRILSVKYWKTWNQKRNGWNRGFSILDSEGMLAAPRNFDFQAQVGNNVDEMVKGKAKARFATLNDSYIRQTYFGAPGSCHQSAISIERQHWPVIVAPLENDSCS